MEVTVRAAEELVAAADREQRGTGRDRLPDARRLRRQILRDQRLLAVLATADVEQVVVARPDRLGDRHRAHFELVAPPGRTPREHRDVAAVGIDVQVVRIEMPDNDLHAARSQ